MTGAKLIEAYQQGKRDFRGANLRGANLRGADLRDADLSGASLRDADLRGANLSGADLCGANLYGADLYGAYLSGANLGGANLAGADLRDANLAHANLAHANLVRANLRGANLGGTYLARANLANQWIIQGVTRSDGYQFILTNFISEGVRLKAGCRNFTMPEAYKHWITTRGGTKLGDETIAILDNLRELARVRGYLDQDGNWIGELK